MNIDTLKIKLTRLQKAISLITVDNPKVHLYSAGVDVIVDPVKFKDMLVIQEAELVEEINEATRKLNQTITDKYDHVGNYLKWVASHQAVVPAKSYAAYCNQIDVKGDISEVQLILDAMFNKPTSRGRVPLVGHRNIT